MWLKSLSTLSQRRFSTMKYAVRPPSIPTLPVVGQDAVFPIHRIYCVGRNYAEHAREMGGDPDREPPFFFTKPADAAVPCLNEKEPTEIPYPLATNNLHHEIELVVAIGKSGVELEIGQAKDVIFGYGVGIDLTRRDLQSQAKEKSRPWDSAKAFDRSAPMSAIHPGFQFKPDGKIWLNVNGEQRQMGQLGQMIWSVPEIISHLSHEFELQQGDLILTGTPAGVGPIARGDIVEAGIDGLGEIKLTIV